MKKALVLAVFAAAAIPVFAQQQQQPANSLPEGFFLSVSGGYAWSGIHKFSDQTYTRFDNSDTAYKAGFGYQHNQNMATELSYVNFGNTDVAATKTAKNKITSYSLSEKLYPTINSAFKPFARIGLTYLRNEEESSTSTIKKSRTNMTYGLGFDYMLSQKVRLGLEYEVHGKAGSANSASGDPTQVKPRATFITFTTSF